MKENLLIFCVVLISLSIFGNSHLMAETTLNLATVDNFPPYQYRDNGKLTGIAIEVVNEMAQRLGIKVNIKAYPWSRVIDSVKHGVVDGGFSVFMTEERKAFCLYTGVIQYEQYHVFVKKGKEFSFSGIEDLYGRTIGIDRGVFVSKTFEKAVNDRKFILEEVNDMVELNVKKVYQGRLDAMIGDYGVVPYYAKSSGLEGEIVSLGPIHEIQASYLVLSKKSSIPNILKLQNQISDKLDEIWKDGTYQEIMNRYYE